MIALQAQVIIVGWQVYSLTHSTFMLGLTGLVEALPAIFCALYAGHIVDISNPLRVYRYALAALAVTNFGFLLVAGDYIALGQDHLLIFIFIGIFCCGLASSFIMPATFALLPMIVQRRDISAASAWKSGTFQIAAIGGPAVAGVIYAAYGAHGAWLMPVSMMVLAVAMSFFMRVPYTPLAVEKPARVFDSMKEGWHFLLKNNALLSIMALDMLAVLLGGAIALLPAIADQILHVGAKELGALRAAPAIGAVLMALLLALKPMKIITARRMLIVVAGFGLCMIGFGLSTSFWLSMFFLALSGAFDSVSMVIRGTLTQLLTPEGFRGRVSAVNSMFVITSNEIGAFYSGVMATLLGLVPAVVLGGFGTLAVVGGTAILSPKFRKLSVKTD